MRIYLQTLGCKLNESELETWSRKFAQQGDEIVRHPGEADICVLNTCTVTSSAARKSRNLARQLARANPRARLVLTGCYASMDPNQARALPNVALVVPNSQKDSLVQMASGLLPISACTVSATQPTTGQAATAFQNASLRTRAFVKIQDGCNMSCTYCIIPLARGKERSRPLPAIVSEVQALVDAGYKEIILTGVQISVYDNKNSKAHGLRDLVAAILNETDVPRLRLTSIAPWDLDAALLELFGDARVCRHLHLSLQSGSDTILRRMRRPYTTRQFAEVVDWARRQSPDVAITTDVIVGFPGESDVEFDQSLQFVQQLEFARVHVFPYSARAGTIAAGLPRPVSDATKESRAKRMEEVAAAAARAFRSRFVGRKLQVLWETSEKTQDASPPLWSGYTDNYIRVTAPCNQNLHNQIADAILTDVAEDGAYGQLADSRLRPT